MSPFNAFRKSLTVKRPASGSYVNGVWVASAAATEITIKASVQPASTEEMETLPEARRAQGVYTLFSSTKFQSLQENTNNPDIVVINSQDYEIMRCEPWQNGLLNHYKALAARVQPT